MAKKLTSSKAKEILHDKSVHGQPLTDKQRRFFGAIAGGAKPYKAESGGWLDQYEQGGLILKKKTKDNFGKKSNPNDVQAKTGPGYVGLAYDTTGRNYSPAWGGQFKDGGDIPKAQDGTLEKIYSKWPALKKLGKVTMKPDESFTREKTGVGDIEFFAPNTPQVTYPSGYVAPHPGPGTYGILYNPTTNTDENIRLDMLHGMSDADSHFKRLRNSFERSVKNSDIYGDMKYWYGKDKESGNAEDGKKRWMDNYVDGQIRTLLFEGDRAKQNYSEEEAKELLSNPQIKKKFDKLNTYLQKGQFGSSIPGTVGFTYARTINPAPSNGKYTKKTQASAQNGITAIEEKLNEKVVNPSLDRMLNKADREGISRFLGDHNGPIDAIRHASAASTMASILPSWMNVIPGVSAVNIGLSNLAGAAHELKGSNVLREHASDLYNNFIGSLIGSLPVSEEKKQDIIIKAQKKGVLSSLGELKDGGSMSYYQHGLDFKPKTISQNGSIVSPLGQWEYPGEITTIPSNEITMEGVDYDVLGVSNTGDKKLMKPGKDYKFDGEYVTEYPRGGWLDKYK